MCLAIPGEVLEIRGDDALARVGRVSFGGIVKEVNLAFVPEATIGCFVLVHAGVAISTIDDEEAARVFASLEEYEDLASARASAGGVKLGEDGVVRVSPGTARPESA